MNQSLNRLKLWKSPQYLGWVIVVAVGFILRIRQYLANRSLWADEASLALNLVQRSLGGLLQPLDYHQAAPIGFLLVEKVFMLLFGNRDYVLHLFPLLAGLLSVYLVARIAQGYFGNLGIITVVFFAGNTWLTYYSSELKQYGTDVTIALLLVYLAFLCLKENQIKNYVWLGVAGSLAVWMSHTSVFILAAIGITLVVEKIVFQKEYKSLIQLFAMGFVWLVSFGIHYMVALQYTAADDYFQRYWRRAFLPLPPWDNLRWYLKTYYSFLLIMFDRTDLILFYLFPAMAVLGILSLLFRRRDLALIVILSFLMTFIASAWGKYPLVYRFMLFLIPFALFLITEAVGCIYSLIARWNKPTAFLLSAAPVAIMLWYSLPFTIETFITPQVASEIKPIMEYVGEKRQPDDIIYVYYGSVVAFQYYAPFYDLETGHIILPPDQPTKKLGIKEFFRDVDDLAGNERVWFIFSDIIDCDGCAGDMRLYFVDSLSEYGILLDRVEAPGAGGYLYDLNP